jgi:hypothetical protein
MRDRVQLQLNRGEGRHALSKPIFFGNQGVFRTGDVDELMNNVNSLSVLSNRVLVWNTTHIAEIIASLESTAGERVPTDHGCLPCKVPGCWSVDATISTGPCRHTRYKRPRALTATSYNWEAGPPIGRDYRAGRRAGSRVVATTSVAAWSTGAPA